MTDTPSREERLLMPITAWRDLGYEGPLSHEQVVDALWKLGEYSPEGVAVERTVAQLRADLAREKAEVERLKAELNERSGCIYKCDFCSDRGEE